MWTVDSGDWSEEASAESVYSHVIGGAGNGTIVVLHFDSPTTLDSTAQVLPRAIDDLRASGYRLVTITELLTGRP
jgi:peptidoglycan/xylan/chitin deacetylase (PgdA/CDA1 family)